MFFADRAPSEELSVSYAISSSTGVSGVTACILKTSWILASVLQ
jgi:hypothetical protein